MADSRFEYIYAPLALAESGLSENDKSRIILLPPEYLGDCESATEKKLDLLYKAGYRNAAAHTVGHIELLKRNKFRIYGTGRLNCTNSESLAFFAEQGLCDIIVSAELSLKRLNSLKADIIKRGFMAYGKLPLMLTRRCPVSDGRPCGGKPACPKKITDRRGNVSEILCSENTVEILNSDTLWLADKLGGFEAEFAVLRFTTEKEMAEITERFFKALPYEGAGFTRGLYFRELK